MCSENPKSYHTSAAPRLECAFVKCVANQNIAGNEFGGKIFRRRKNTSHKSQQASWKTKHFTEVFDRVGAAIQKSSQLWFLLSIRWAENCSGKEICEVMLRILRRIATYNEKEMWRADKHVLFYRQQPDWSQESKAVSGFKNEKYRQISLVWFKSDC